MFPRLALDAGASPAARRGRWLEPGGVGSAFGGQRRQTAHAITTWRRNASWDLDVWGRIRRPDRKQTSRARRSSAADLANARLSAQATLAIDYFDLRAEDALQALLDDTVAHYQRALQITRESVHAGTAARSDVMTAQAQLQTTQAQADRRRRAARAVRACDRRADRPSAGGSDDRSPRRLATDVPVIPPGVPSQLLERRPDIAAAERQMQAGECADRRGDRGVLSRHHACRRCSGMPALRCAQLFNGGQQVWSLGASATQTLFQRWPARGAGGGRAGNL